MLKKIAKLGLVGLLSLGVTGCAISSGYKYDTWMREDVYAYDERKEVTEEKKRETRIAYRINDFKNQDCNVNFSVKESKKSINDIIIKTIIPVYKEVSNVRREYGYYMTMFGPSDEYPQGMAEVLSEERTKVRDDVSEKKEKREEVIYENQPAKDVPVKISSQYFGFGTNNDSSVLIKTDENGTAKVQITKMPYLWYLKDKESKGDLIEILKKGMKKSLLEKIDKNLTFPTKDKEYPIDVKTMSEANLLLTEENLKIKDEEKTFQIAGKEIDISPLYSYIRSIIKADLESKYMPKTIIIRVVGEDSIPVEAFIEFKAVKTLSLEEVLQETEKIKEKYLVKGEELFERVNINPSYLVCNLNGQREVISQDGLEININVPSEYDIKVIKEGYVPAEERKSFTRAMKGRLPVKMYRLGTPVTIGTGKSSIDVE